MWSDKFLTSIFSQYCSQASINITTIAIIFSNITSNVFFLIQYPCILLLIAPPPWCNSPSRTSAAFFLRFLDHKQWHTTVGRTPLDEWSARRRELYMATNNTHKTDIHTPTEFELANPERERSQTPGLDRSATGISLQVIYCGTVPEHVMEPSTNLPILSSNGCEWSALPQHSLSARRCAVQRGCGDFGEDKTSFIAGNRKNILRSSGP